MNLNFIKIVLTWCIFVKCLPQKMVEECMHQEENHMEEKINFCLCSSVNYCAKQVFLGSGNNNMIGRIMPHPHPIKQTNQTQMFTSQSSEPVSMLGQITKRNYSCTWLTLIISWLESGEIILDMPGGPSITTKVPKRGRPKERIRERDVMTEAE